MLHAADVAAPATLVKQVTRRRSQARAYNMFDIPDETKRARAARPRDAATLVLVRKTAREPEVLMGKRNAALKFMPGKYVFPGGRVDPSDVRLTHTTDLRPEVLARLAIHGGESRARALARAAVREMFEEAGLVIGRPTVVNPRSRSPGWTEFFGRGVEPDLPVLTYVMRAITPPYRDRRFDTRFFIADGTPYGDQITAPRGQNDELTELSWFAVPDAMQLDLPSMTRIFLQHLQERGDALHSDGPVPFYSFARGKGLMVHI